jgi:predicted permease
MSYTEILNVILPTFAAILIGYLIGKVVKIDITGLIDIVFYVGLPALTFVSVLSQEISLLDAAKVWSSAIVVTLGCGALAWVVFKIKKEKHSGLYLPISLPNTLNIPFPIISLAYGSAGLLVATLYYIPNVILIYSAGVFVANGKSWRENLKEMYKVPAVYASLLALLFNLLHIGLPPLVTKTLGFIGGMVVPAVILALGYSLAKVKITSFPTTILASVIRLGGGFGLGLLMIYLFHMTGIFRSVTILMSAMPGAVNTYMLAAKYKNEPELVASVVLVTTICSLVLIPVMLHFLS